MSEDTPIKHETEESTFSEPNGDGGESKEESLPLDVIANGLCSSSTSTRLRFLDELKQHGMCHAIYLFFYACAHVKSVRGHIHVHTTRENPNYYILFVLYLYL